MDGTDEPTRPEPDGATAEEALLHRARAGDQQAIESLYADHVASARRLARILVGTEPADELVAEAFARVLGQMRAGGGPTSSFRAYLNTTIRNLHRDQLRRRREVPVSDRPWLLEESESPIDEFVEGLDANGATAALASLPGTWQQILWHSEVEGRKPAEIAQLLSTNPAAVSSLVYRAREGLRRAYLDQYAGPAPTSVECHWTRSRLSQYVRDDLSGRASGKVSTHLDTCAACAGAYADMAALNTKLAAYLFPVVLVGAMHALDTSGGATSPLLAELAARAEGIPVAEAASAANAGSGGTGRVSTRASVAAAAVVVLLAIAATTFALTRGDGEPQGAPDVPTESDTVIDPAAPDVPTSTPTSTAPEDPPTTAVTDPSLPVSTTPTAPVTSDPNLPLPSTTVPLPLPTVPPTSPPPTEPEPEPEPQPIVVRPVAPAATPISRCGTYGALRMPFTTGVRYTLLEGDGRQGPWAVGASAVPGFVIAKGAPRRFTGDLGRYKDCPVTLAIREVTNTPVGNDQWQIRVTPRMPDDEQRSLSVSFWFDSDVRVARHAGEGWTCRGPGGVDVTDRTFAAGTKLTCSYGARGKQPPPVSLVARALGGSGSPAGQVALTADGDVIDIEDFDSVDH